MRENSFCSVTFVYNHRTRLRMRIEPNGAAGVELMGPASDGFISSVASLFGREPDDTLRPALPFSVIARNCAARPIALLGIRFDMTSPSAKRYAVVHYADTLRCPEQAALPPGAMRFVCAEPLYTDLVLRHGSEVDLRARMNLDNLSKLLGIKASVDCAAFDDGQFAGPDSLGAFERFGIEREAEMLLLDEILRPDKNVEKLLLQATELGPGEMRNPAATARRNLGRRLHGAWVSGGFEAVEALARNYRLRIRLWR